MIHKNYGMKKKGRFKRHFKRHWKKYAGAGAGLAGGAGLLSLPAIGKIFKLSGKAGMKGWGRTSRALSKTGTRLAKARTGLGNFFRRFKRKKTG